MAMLVIRPVVVKNAVPAAELPPSDEIEPIFNVPGRFDYHLARSALFLLLISEECNVCETEKHAWGPSFVGF